ncbi:hypothetical protein HZB06_02800 [Candidatus Wolfebacteria bacterium]|nr:hypothetical protein [Candidatus Wolfebacteria bacterium]
MKTLLILAVILGVLFFYFVAKSERTLITKGNELIPGGVNIPKLIFDKAGEIKSRIVNLTNAENVGSGAVSEFFDKIKNTAEDLVTKTVNTMSNGKIGSNSSSKSPIINNVVPQDKLNIKEAEIKELEAQEAIYEKTLSETLSQYETLKNQISSIDSQIKQLNDNLNAIKDRISKLKIK